MSRRSNIRWKSSDEKELSRVVKNYNAKINRLLKKDPELQEFLPRRVSKKELKEMIVTRQDLKRELNSLKRFSRRGSEEIIENDVGLKLTKYQKREIDIQVRTINRLKSKRREELLSLEETSQNKKTGNKVNMFGNIDELQMLEPLHYDFKKMDKRNFDHFIKGLKDYNEWILNKDKILRQNYIDALYEQLGDNLQTRALAEKLENMSLQNFVNKFYSDREADISFIYDPLGSLTKIEILMDVWEVDDSFENMSKFTKDSFEQEQFKMNTEIHEYIVYDKYGKKLKTFGTERGAKRFVDENFNTSYVKI